MRWRVKTVAAWCNGRHRTAVFTHEMVETHEGACKAAASASSAARDRRQNASERTPCQSSKVWSAAETEIGRETERRRDARLHFKSSMECAKGGRWLLFWFFFYMLQSKTGANTTTQALQRHSLPPRYMLMYTQTEPFIRAAHTNETSQRMTKLTNNLPFENGF